MNLKVIHVYGVINYVKKDHVQLLHMNYKQLLLIHVKNILIVILIKRNVVLLIIKELIVELNQILVKA